ncbi:MAG: hypothetical protein JXR48_15190 [Candidatus Delongbacteria bacterium]|nr:hypothetical protein [Candidatus Delongbacteria bacterium]MBN2836302.1 hypothetical protein [Candidatus Delongbacteria bacterium]
MPNWNQKPFDQLKQLIKSYDEFLNRVNDNFGEYLDRNSIMSRGDIYRGRDQIIQWFKNIENNFGPFKLKDATATFFSDSHSRVLLYFEIKKDDMTETMVESMDLCKYGDNWRVKDMFALSYEPEYHEKYFV